MCHRKDYTAQHPDVDLRVDLVLEIPVYHFWRSIHHCCKLFKSFELLLTPLLSVENLVLAGRTEITKLESLVVKKNIFNFDIAVSYA